MIKKIRLMKDILLGGKLLLWTMFYFQRLFLSKVARGIFFDVVMVFQKISGRQMARTECINEGKVVQLRDSGILFLPKIITHDEVLETVTDLETKMVFDPYSDPERLFPIPTGVETQKFHIAHHRPIDVISAPHLLAIANNSEILQIVEGFLGVKPTIAYMAAWWSFATDHESVQAENFHRDVDSVKSIKLFFFLTDVDQNNGPHVYVPYSANADQFRESIRRYTDKEVRDVFGEDAIKEITGEAGSVFLEDTFGLHKGLKLKSGRRLLFQVMYSVGKVPYSPAAPIGQFANIGNDHNFDAWSNRVYFAR